MLSPGTSSIVTILLNIVIGVIVPTPGRHLKCPEKVNHLLLPIIVTDDDDDKVNILEAHWDHSGVVGQKVT